MAAAGQAWPDAADARAQPDEPSFLELALARRLAADLAQRCAAAISLKRESNAAQIEELAAREVEAVAAREAFEAQRQKRALLALAHLSEAEVGELLAQTLVAAFPRDWSVVVDRVVRSGRPGAGERNAARAGRTKAERERGEEEEEEEEEE
jgi:hypothetical protein